MIQHSTVSWDEDYNLAQTSTTYSIPYFVVAKHYSDTTILETLKLSYHSLRKNWHEELIHKQASETQAKINTCPSIFTQSLPSYIRNPFTSFLTYVTENIQAIALTLTATTAVVTGIVALFVKFTASILGSAIQIINPTAGILLSTLVDPLIEEAFRTIDPFESLNNLIDRMEDSALKRKFQKYVPSAETIGVIDKTITTTIIVILETILKSFICPVQIPLTIMFHTLMLMFNKIVDLELNPTQMYIISVILHIMHNLGVVSFGITSSLAIVILLVILLVYGARQYLPQPVLDGISRFVDIVMRKNVILLEEKYVEQDEVDEYTAIMKDDAKENETERIDLEEYDKEQEDANILKIAPEIEHQCETETRTTKAIILPFSSGSRYAVYDIPQPYINPDQFLKVSKIEFDSNAQLYTVTYDSQNHCEDIEPEVCTIEELFEAKFVTSPVSLVHHLANTPTASTHITLTKSTKKRIDRVVNTVDKLANEQINTDPVQHSELLLIYNSSANFQNTRSCHSYQALGAMYHMLLPGPGDKLKVINSSLAQFKIPPIVMPISNPNGSCMDSKNTTIIYLKHKFQYAYQRGVTGTVKDIKCYIAHRPWTQSKKDLYLKCLQDLSQTLNINDDTPIEEAMLAVARTKSSQYKTQYIHKNEVLLKSFSDLPQSSKSRYPGLTSRVVADVNKARVIFGLLYGDMFKKLWLNSQPIKEDNLTVYRQNFGQTKHDLHIHETLGLSQSPTDLATLYKTLFDHFHAMERDAILLVGGDDSDIQIYHNGKYVTGWSFDFKRFDASQGEILLALERDIMTNNKNLAEYMESTDNAQRSLRLEIDTLIIKRKMRLSGGWNTSLGNSIIATLIMMIILDMLGKRTSSTKTTYAQYAKEMGEILDIVEKEFGVTIKSAGRVTGHCPGYTHVTQHTFLRCTFLPDKRMVPTLGLILKPFMKINSLPTYTQSIGAKAIKHPNISLNVNHIVKHYHDAVLSSLSAYPLNPLLYLIHKERPNYNFNETSAHLAYGDENKWFEKFGEIHLQPRAQEQIDNYATFNSDLDQLSNRYTSSTHPFTISSFLKDFSGRFIDGTDIVTQLGPIADLVLSTDFA
jgi:hypothetical protein